MSLFVQESGLSLCLWILGSIAVAITLLLLSMFEGKRDELRESVIFPEGSFTAAISDVMVGPQERLKKLEGKINNKCTKLEISQEKLEETKRTISELEVTSEEVQVKYQELLKQLKSELWKTETECQHLHDQIEMITTKRDKLKQELDCVGSGLISQLNSETMSEEELFLCETQTTQGTVFPVQDTRSEQTTRPPGWPSLHSTSSKFVMSTPGISTNSF